MTGPQALGLLVQEARHEPRSCTTRPSRSRLLRYVDRAWHMMVISMLRDSEASTSCPPDTPGCPHEQHLRDALRPLRATGRSPRVPPAHRMIGTRTAAADSAAWAPVPSIERSFPARESQRCVGQRCECSTGPRRRPTLVAREYGEWICDSPPQFPHLGVGAHGGESEGVASVRRDRISDHPCSSASRCPLAGTRAA